MFFLITHILIGKYYPNLFTQFIIGCTFYILSFIIIKDIITNNIYEQYKCYILPLVTIDIIFLIYKTKTNLESKKISQQFKITDRKDNIIHSSTDFSNRSITLSSEINNFKIVHDNSEQTDKNSIFSISDNESEKVAKNTSKTP